MIASTGAVLGLALAGAWSPRCGHRSNLAIAFLLAAFCGAGLALVPRLNGRAHGRVETERPVAEILCRPEGSALFFRKCGDSCELDAVTRTELSVTDCRFEPQFRLPVNFLELMNRFALTHINSGKGSMDGDDDDLSEPERGDLPQKVPAQAVGHVEEETDPLADIETVDDTLFPDQSGSYSSSGVAPYEYDYDENHRQDTILPERQKRQIVPLMADDDGLGLHHRHFDDELEIAERADLPHTSSPHICFSSYSSSTTTCKLRPCCLVDSFFVLFCCRLFVISVECFRSRLHGYQSSVSIQYVLLLRYYTQRPVFLFAQLRRRRQPDPIRIAMPIE